MIHLLQKLTPLKKGDKIREACSSERMNAISELLWGLARGENIKTAGNVHKRKMSASVILSGDRPPPPIAPKTRPFEVLYTGSVGGDDGDPPTPQVGVNYFSTILRNLAVTSKVMITELYDDVSYPSAPTGAFTCPDIGQKIWAEFTLDGESAEIKHGDPWDGYPNPIIFDSDDETKQVKFNAIIAEVVATGDERPGLTIGGATPRKIVQLLDTNLRARMDFADGEQRVNLMPWSAAAIGAFGNVPNTAFTGNAYINKVKIEELDSNPSYEWVDCNLLRSTATEISDYPDTPKVGHVYFKKSRVVGDIIAWDFIPTGIAVPYTGSSTDIPDGFALCDGTANAAGNGGSGRNLSGKFIVCIGADGEGHTYTDGATGGSSKHGGSTNNHDDHPLEHTHPQAHDPHTHDYTPSVPSACVGGLDGYSMDLGFGWNASPDTVGDASWMGDPPNTGAASWADPDYNKHSETDNRPPFYALAFIERLNPA